MQLYFLLVCQTHTRPRRSFRGSFCIQSPGHTQTLNVISMHAYTVNIHECMSIMEQVFTRCSTHVQRIQVLTIGGSNFHVRLTQHIQQANYVLISLHACTCIVCTSINRQHIQRRAYNNSSIQRLTSKYIQQLRYAA